MLYATSVAAVVVFLESQWTFVTGRLPVPLLSPSSNRLGRVTLRAEGEEGEEEPKKKVKVITKYVLDWGVTLDGDVLDNLGDFYEEALRGSGGQPTGFMRDLMLRSFFGRYTKSNWVLRSYYYSGKKNTPAPEDYSSAYNMMKAAIKGNTEYGKRYVGLDDRKGWTWLACKQLPADGLVLYLTRSPPYGERALALIKDGEEDRFFDKVDWGRLFIRLHKPNLWGGKVQDFIYPIARGLKGALEEDEEGYS